MHFASFCHLQAAAYNSNIIDYLWNAVWMYAFTKSRHFTENRACVPIGGETSDKDILTLRCQTGPKNRRTGYCHARSVNQQLINSGLQEVISLLNDITKKAKFKIFLEVGRKRQILTVLHSIKEKPDVDYGNSRNYWKPLYTGMPLKPSKDRLSIPTPQQFGLICDTSMLIWEWEFKKLPEVSLWSHLVRSYKKNNSKNVRDKWWRFNYLWIAIMIKKKLGQRMWIRETFNLSKLIFKEHNPKKPSTV